MPAAKRLPAPATSWAAAPVTWTGGLLVVTVPLLGAEVVGAAVVLVLVVEVAEEEAEVEEVAAAELEEVAAADEAAELDVAVPAEAHKALAAERTAEYNVSNRHWLYISTIGRTKSLVLSAGGDNTASGGTLDGSLVGSTALACKGSSSASDGTGGGRLDSGIKTWLGARWDLSGGQASKGDSGECVLHVDG
jgi:hypothetical protein